MKKEIFLNKINHYSLLITKVFYKLHLNFPGRVIARIRIKRATEYLKSQIPESLKKTYSISNDSISYKEQPVFMLWFQGIEKMPYVVRQCYENAKKTFADRTLILLTEENLHDYIDFSEELKKHIQDGKLSITSTSDIIRASVLNKFGGTWVDATAFISSSISEDYFNKNFYCPCGFSQELKKEWRYIFKKTNGWTIWFMGSNKINYPLFAFLESAYSEYFKNNEMVVDYFQTDLLISIFYSINESFRKDINSLKPNNTEAYELMSLFCKPENKLTESKIHEISASTQVHKLTYKKKIDYEKKLSFFITSLKD